MQVGRDGLYEYHLLRQCQPSRNPMACCPTPAAPLLRSRSPSSVWPCACLVVCAVTTTSGVFSQKEEMDFALFQGGYFLQDVDFDQVDPTSFSGPKSELKVIDPQQRLLLEVAYECMENAGATCWQGTNIGCFVANYIDDWQDILAKDTLSTDTYTVQGQDPMMLANRISYEYDLRGPSMTIKTGCSSALVCLDTASSYLRKGDCDGALICGSSLILSPNSMLSLDRMGVLSPSGCGKTFDASADGFGRGEAINAIYVKTLSRAIEDGDDIRAVVRGTTVGSDGWTKAINIPSGEQHEVLMRRAYQQAGIADLSETAFIECHGTGTSVGDPIETNAIANCVGSKGMLLTSVKPNVGHGEGAAGLTSVIKAVLALEHRLVPPNIFFKTPNPKIPFEEAKLRVPVETENWPEGRAERVGVNSFGIGGTNAHAILESLHQYSTGQPKAHVDSNGAHGDRDGAKPHLLLFSALSEASVMSSAKRHIDYLQNSGASAKDIAYTLAHRRDHKTYRTYAIVDGKSPPEAPASVAVKSAPIMGWVFTGQGAQWAGMGAELIRSDAVFTRTVRRLDRFLDSLPSPPSWTIAGELGKTAAASRVLSSELSSALCTAVQIGLVDVLRSWNVQPDFVVGHSVGEVAAAYASGAMTAEAALAVSYFRGLSMPAKKGSMASLGLGRNQVSPLLEPGVVVACENSQSSVTISGDAVQVDKVLRRVRNEHPGVLARLLRVETAFHSEHVHENGASYEKSMRPYIDSQQPETAFYSSLTGERLSNDQRLGPWYWRANMEQPVLFNSALRSALSDHRARVFMTEIGPHPALQGPINQILRGMGRVDDVHAASLRREQGCLRSLLELAGNMFRHGVPGLRLAAVVPAGQFVRGLPSYSWARQPAPLAQPRMAREWRQHQHAPHELLGIRAWELSDEPAWRNKLSVSRSRWLIGHEIQNRIMMPAAAYISMVGEALRQLHGHTGYEVRNVTFSAALLLPVDGEVEMATRLRTVEASQSSAWRGFVISSYDGESWIQHCRGEARPSSSPLEASLHDTSALVRRVDADGWYECFRRQGLGYSGCFRGLRSITAATTEDKAMATLARQDTGVWCCVHPASIDHALQLLYLASTRGLGRKLDHLRVPTFVGHMALHQVAEDQDSMVATARWTETGGDVVVRQDGKQLLSLRGVEMSPLSHPEEESLPLISRLDWRRHIKFCPGESLIKQGTSFSTERALLDELVGLYCVDNVETLDLPDSHAQPHLAKLARFIKKRAQGAPSSSQLTREGRVSRMGEIYAQGQSTAMPALFLYAKTVFDASSSVLAGSMHLLQAVLDREDDMFHEMYFRLGREANVADLIQAMAHLNPRLRVLETGAGSGGFTRAFLDLTTTKASGERSYESYTFTDVSAPFLTSARERFAHYHGIIYDVLDLEKDPACQGFPLESYHLIVASNVVHATRSIQKSLRHLRSLLRPGGRLLMTEPVSDFESVATYLWGPFAGWWLGEADNRPDHPLLPPEQWCKELVTAGFEKPDYVAGSLQATYTASRGWDQLSEMSPTSKGRVSLLCYAPDGPLVDELRVKLGSVGIAADICLFGDCMPSSGQTVISLLDVDDRHEPVVHGMDEAAFNTLFGLFRANEKETVIWLTRPSQVGCRDPRYSMILGTARTMRTEKNARFYTVEVDEEQNSIAAATGLLTDLLMTPEMLGPGLDDGDADWEYAVIDGQVLIPRMHWQSLSSALVQSKGNRKDTHESSSAVQLRIQKRGMLKSLTWEMRDVRKPSHGEVLVKTKAVGINFLDVAKSLGLVQLGGDKLGLEGSGVVVETGPGVEGLSVGDNVLFFCDTGAFRSAVVLPDGFCTRFDDSLTFEQAASLTIIYTTVIKALVHIARLGQGQTLLLHSACGGVGLAAIQVARKLGAEIYCTVGTDAKRRYLTEKLSVSPTHIFGSRDPSFLGDVMRATNNRGVDVVLNSLSGELLQASWNCVAKGGIMVEIGKVDFQQRSNLSMERFEANRTFAGLELLSLVRENRAELRRLTDQMLEWIRQGHIQPVTIAKVWEANQVQQAFRSMQRGDHIGKIVVRMPDDASSLASAATRCRTEPNLRPDGCYLIVGGLGGIGRAVANWLAENGARHLVFLSRSARQGPDVDGFVEELASQGCQARLVAGDVSILADVERAVKTAAEPIKGVVNLAMALEDAAFDNMTFAQWTACVTPKVLGTWNLDSVLASCELDFFILTSSINGLIGGRGQANYAAASSFLDSFVQYRHSKGLVASVIDLGLVAGIGFASRMTNLHINLGRLEPVPLMEKDVLESINLAMRSLGPSSATTGVSYAAPGQIVAGLITNSKAIRQDEQFRKDSRLFFVHGLISATTESEPRRKTAGAAKDLITLAKQQPSLLQGDEAVKAIADDLVSAFTYMSNRDAGSVDAGHSLAAAGLDSLLAVELRGWLWGEMGVDVPSVVITQSSSFIALAELVRDELVKRRGG
ncbi:polyketide synthase [Ophiocordyceps camponoti-floridani]|uniref:Polyketide synthase n=1 Tax=Ophiocordyceps camponoti-floridani TaxID=2030778 RepID=A0A8H4QB41_9HYPO|nr:polyketide synthase [Ophiocordyceps camponoti-floridani]